MIICSTYAYSLCLCGNFRELQRVHVHPEPYVDFSIFFVAQSFKKSFFKLKFYVHIDEREKYSVQTISEYLRSQI